MSKSERRTLIYLASGSPRRKAILEELGIPHQVLTVNVEEVVRDPT